MFHYNFSVMPVNFLLGGCIPENEGYACAVISEDISTITGGGMVLSDCLKLEQGRHAFVAFSVNSVIEFCPPWERPLSG